MHKPPYIPHFSAKTRINYKATWTKLTQLLRNPGPILPADVPADVLEAFGYRRIKRELPKCKGNVHHTMKEILRIFLAQWEKATRPINLSIRTHRASLAKTCGNRDPQTAYLHILTLIKHGFLRGKVRTGHGLFLLLNPALLVWHGAAGVVPVRHVPAPGRPAAPEPRAPEPAPAEPLAPPPFDLLAHLTQLADKLRNTFSPESKRR